ncbi:MAG TPA: prepilin-type N-terminal cleavage/methylation domain-containing protein [Terriglobales bacterium]|nr:prepilin-type N-terminal cleavage/methylation domain-containing protein [Terriglobales bacterium]
MKPRGFTLVEILLALALASFFLYGGAVSFKAFAPKLRLETGVWQVRSALNEARFGAAWTGAPRRVRFTASGFTLEVRDEASKSWRTVRAARLEGVSVSANNDPAFYPEGTVANLATITVANARGAYTITVAISGRVKVVRAG